MLVLMGSGENSPAMVTPHQKILKTFGKTAKAHILDTPFGFQENADELTKKISDYFSVNVGYPVSDIQLRNGEADPNAAIAEIDQAQWLFSGPGSPTYALRSWKKSGVDQALLRLLDRGAIVLASAAAMTSGSKVMPVYEMYRAGEDPYWLDGINLLEAATGINAAVVAHYNNMQGGTHDTRFCFIGERRMKVLDAMLPEGVAVLGVDEHTGVAFNLDESTAEIFGKGVLTLRKEGRQVEFQPKTTVSLDEIRQALSEL